MMTHSIFAAGLALVIHCGSSDRDVDPQTPAAAIRVENAVAMFLRPRVAGKTAIFDGSVLGQIGFETPAAFRRNAERARQLADLLGAEVRDLDKAIRCENQEPATCRLLDAEVALRIGQPEIGGDSATVWTYLRTIDSAAEHRVQAEDVQYLFREVNGRWEFVRALKARASKPG